MAAGDRTPYQILGVPEDVEYVELRKVYRTKIHEHKTKRISAINFRRICRAYETLSDFGRRKTYKEKKTWTSEITIDNYTPQQLAAEPDLIRDLKQRLRHASLTKLNAQDPVTGHTPLYTASRAGNVEAVKFLTDQGAEPDLSQRTKSTALHVASFYGHADVVRCLLESGADHRIENAGGSTARDEAFNGEVVAVFTELEQNAYVRAAVNQLSWFYENGLTQHVDTEYFTHRQTLLHCASKKGYDQLAHWLVEEKLANVDLVDNNGNSALHLAAYGGHTSIVKYLLDSGCDSTLKNRWGTTAEEEGSKHGRELTRLFQRMRERDMFEMAKTGVHWWFYYYFEEDSKDKSDTTGISLLYYACSYGHYEVAKWLLEHGADVNIRMKTKPRSTPLHGANYRGHVAIVELLLEYGADVNIKNDFGATVFDENPVDEVDRQLAKQIKDLLVQYKNNLTSEKLIDVHVYEDDSKEKDPVAKLKLELKAGYEDLLGALSKIVKGSYPYFSIAHRALDFTSNETTIISAVACARYTSSKFVETPICLVRHKTLPAGCLRLRPTRQLPKIELRSFTRSFQSQAKENAFILKAPLLQKKVIGADGVAFVFSEQCLTNDIDIRIFTLASPDPHTFHISGCICLFKVELFSESSNLTELPLVSIVDQPFARLYTLATPAPYWFTSHTRRTRLPTIGGFHAFVRHADIIPGHLTLPDDMVIAAALDRPLPSRSNPTPCTYLHLCERDTRTYSDIAYHGTSINVIRSILLDGLVVPGTLVSSGQRINPPKNHIARDTTAFKIADFAAAIFLSPSIHYSIHPTYAVPFESDDQQLIPVLECSVKSKSYAVFSSTVSNYTAHPGDNMNAIEWRITDPASVQINAVLFITQIASIAASKAARITRTT